MKSLPERRVKGLFIGCSDFARDNAAMFFSLQPGSAHSPVKRWRLAACVLCAAALAMPPAVASGKDDHDRARQAVQAGQVLPLPTVLERLQRRFQARCADRRSCGDRRGTLHHFFQQATAANAAAVTPTGETAL